MRDYLLNELENISKENNSFAIVAKYLIDLKDVSSLSVNDIVDNCYVSLSTPTRLAKRLDYDGFKELKYELKMAKEEESKNKNSSLKSSDYYSKLLKGLDTSLQTIDEETISNIADKISNAKKIVIYAVGDTSLVAKDFKYKLERLGKYVVSYNDYHLQRVHANLSDEHVLSIGITYSGLTQEVLNSLKMAKKSGSETILISSKNVKGEYIDNKLIVAHVENALRNYSMISRISMLVVLDLIYLKYIENNKKDNLELFSKTKINK